MNTHKRPVAVLYNGQRVAIRNRIIRGGMVVGLSRWDGGFINIANVAFIDYD